MPFRLSKEEAKTLSKHSEKLAQLSGQLDVTIVEYNETVTGLRSEVEEAVTEYNTALAEAREFCSQIAAQGQEDFSDKSEKWQESDSGQSAEEWISSWEGIDLSDVTIEWPDELTNPDPDHAEELTNLPPG